MVKSHFAVHMVPTAVAPHAPDDSPSTRRDAIIGFTLASLAPTTPQDRLNGQARLYACLPRSTDYGPSVSVAYAIHYLVTPAGPHGSPASVSCTLLARLSDWQRGPRQVRETAHEFGANLRALLLESLPNYRFAPVMDHAAVRNVLAPFPIRDLVEIRSRWERFSNGVSLPIPFSGFPSVEALIPHMSAQNEACMLSVGFSPIPESLDQFLETDSDDGDVRSTLIGALLPQSDDEPWTQRAREAVTNDEMSTRFDMAAVNTWLRTRVTSLYQPFHLRVQLASASRLSLALIKATGVEFGGPSKLNVTPFWSEPSSASTSGADVIVPRTTPSSSRSLSAAMARSTHPDPRVPPASEFAIAEHNLRSLRATSWGAEPTAIRTPRSESNVNRNVAALTPIVSLQELARLAPLPYHAPWLPTQGNVLRLPYTGGPAQGVRLGVNTAQGEPVPVYWSHAGRMHHAVLLGGTGMGKSTLASQLILDDIHSGRGVVVLDPHDQLVEHVLERIPARRAKDVVLLDVANTSRPVGINPMDLHTPEQQSQLITRFLAQLRHMYDRNQLGMVGPVAMMTLRSGMQAIMGLPHGGTLLEVFRLFNDDQFLAAVMPHVRDNAVRMTLYQFQMMEPHTRAEYVTHGLSKISEWVTDPVMRRIIGQRKSTFDFTTAMNDGAIVLCQLRSGILGSDMAAFLGHTLLPMVYQAALSRLALPAGQRRPCSLYIDEAATFTGDPSIARMLAECRKAALSVNLIYQYLSQAELSVREAVLANTGSIFAFRLSLADAAIMEQLVAPSPISAKDFAQLPRGVAYSSIMLEHGQRSSVFTLETQLSTQRANVARAERIQHVSAERYGRDREGVDAAIASRDDALRWVREGDAR